MGENVNKSSTFLSSASSMHTDNCASEAGREPLLGFPAQVTSNL